MNFLPQMDKVGFGGGLVLQKVHEAWSLQMIYAVIIQWPLQQRSLAHTESSDKPVFLYLSGHRRTTTQIEEASRSTEALTVLFMYFRSNRYVFRCQFQRHHKQSESGHPGTKFSKDLHNIWL